MCTSTSRGRTDWEGFDDRDDARSPLPQAVTTIIDTPLGVLATTTVAGLKAKREAARAQCHVDVGFWGGVQSRGNAH